MAVQRKFKLASTLSQGQTDAGKQMLQQRHSRNGPAGAHVADTLFLQRYDQVELRLSGGCPVTVVVVIMLKDQARYGFDVEEAYLVEPVGDNKCLLDRLPRNSKLIRKRAAVVYWLVRHRPTTAKAVPHWVLWPVNRNSVMTPSRSTTIPVLSVQQLNLRPEQLRQRANIKTLTDDDGRYHLPLGAMQQSLERGTRGDGRRVPSRFAHAPGTTKPTHARHSGLAVWNDEESLNTPLEILKLANVRQPLTISHESQLEINQEQIRRREIQKRPPSPSKAESQTFEPVVNWLRISPKSSIVVDVGLPNGHTCQMMAVVILANPGSPIVGTGGIVYELFMQRVDGDEDDVFAYVPVRIGGYRVKYWLCVYADMLGTKVIGTPDVVSHNELVDSSRRDEDSPVRLCEYKVAKVSMQHGVSPAGVTIEKVETPTLIDDGDPSQKQTMQSLSVPGLKIQPVSTYRFKSRLPVIHARVRRPVYGALEVISSQDL